MTHKDRNIYEFGEFRLSPTENILEKAGDPIPLKPKAFAALVHLVENHGKLVEKGDLLDRVWNGAFVEEASVSKCIWEIRAALSDDTKGSRFIQTVPKRGYRFIADVTATSGTDEEDIVEPVGTIETGELSSADISPVESPESVLLGESDAAVESSDEKSVEIKAKGSRRLIYLAASLVLAVITAGLLYSFFRKPAQANAPGLVSLAVLPLKPAVVESRNQDFELALADSLIMKVSEAKTFTVKRLFAVRKFTDIDTDPVAAGRDLEVDYVLASTYQIFDGRIRVTSQLVNVNTGVSEQTFRSEADAGNIFAVQDTVANDIGNGLFAKFGDSPNPTNLKRATDNEKAYTLYNEALFILDKYTRDDTGKAIDLLDQAIDLDPDYSAAWALKAQAYCQLAHEGGGTPNDLFTKAGPYLEKALAIDGNNAVALTISGMINRDYNWHHEDAYRDLKKAIALDPNMTLARRILAGLYYQDGKFAEALEEGKKAVDLNPTGSWDKWFLADYLAATGSRNEAIEVLLHLAEIEPKFQPTYFSLWRHYFENGEKEKAFEYFIKNKQFWQAKPKEIEHFQKAYKASGWNGVFRAELDLMRSYDRPDQYSTRKVYIAELAAQVGDTGLAFQYLDEAARFRSLQFSNIKVDPLLAPIRSDPRFADLVNRNFQ